MFILILIILIIAIVTVFSVQNANPVTISFLYWRFNASLAIVVFLSLLCGMTVTTLILFSIRLKKSLGTKKNTALED
ncbi:MAG: LapA family protein [Nitrospirota bacterium]|jgi:uncharacterized integral membrane protein